MKFERTQMHFTKDFFAAFAVVRSPYWRSAVAEVSVFNRSLFSFSLPLNCISLVFIYFFISYTMTGKLGGHAGPVMTVLLKETNKESLVFTGSRDHYVKVR